MEPDKITEAALANMASTIRGALAAVFDVAEERLDVRATWTTDGASTGKGWLRISIDLDGKTPPPEMNEMVQKTIGAIAAMVAALSR